jgi:hypothetical protein
MCCCDPASALDGERPAGMCLKDEANVQIAFIRDP